MGYRHVGIERNKQNQTIPERKEQKNKQVCFMSSALGIGEFSLADEDFSASLDLNRLLIEHPPATFFMRVRTTQSSYGIQDGDVLIVDRAVVPTGNSLVLTEGEQELVIRRYRDMMATASGKETRVWGTVTYIIRKG